MLLRSKQRFAEQLISRSSAGIGFDLANAWRNRMKAKVLLGVIALSLAGIAGACGGSPTVGDKVIKTSKSGDLTVALTNSTGELQDGESELYLQFSDASGNTVDVGAASLQFRMPAMGSMAEMNSDATLTTTETPGKYRARLNLEMAGTWEATVNYEGERGKGRTTMSLNAK